MGYGIVGTAFLENSIGAGSVAASETFVILGGFYARLGGLHLEWITVVERSR